MSKIGRKPIVFSTAKVEIQGKKIVIDGPKAKFEHELPEQVDATIEGNKLTLVVEDMFSKDVRMVWGLHRALLANKVIGAETGFEIKMKIVGLGFKALLQGTKVVFNLGYTHKIEFDLPAGVSMEIDKTGQLLNVKSADKFVLGSACDTIRSFRPPEPYKGTGIMRENEVIIRKAGKTKSA
jgi:large subunit ribosomal protein L6